jgi:chromosome segregation ATPase
MAAAANGNGAVASSPIQRDLPATILEVAQTVRRLSETVRTRLEQMEGLHQQVFDGQATARTRMEGYVIAHIGQSATELRQELRTQKAHLETALGELAAAIQELQRSTGTHTTSLSTLGRQISVLDAAIKTLQGQERATTATLENQLTSATRTFQKEQNAALERATVPYRETIVSLTARTEKLEYYTKLAAISIGILFLFLFLVMARGARERELRALAQSVMDAVNLLQAQGKDAGLKDFCAARK